MDNIYKNIEEHNAKRKCKILIIFDNILSNKKLNRLVTELFIKAKHFSCFYHTILFCCAKKFYSLFYYENSK